MALLTFSELQAIKPISANNAGKFDNLLKETLIKDIKPLLGYEFYQDLTQNESTTPNAKLLSGDTYTYSGIDYTFEGLKTVIAYFLYANYVMTSWYSDTFTGFVGKNHDDAQPASSGDKKNLRDMNIEIARQHWEDCKYFITANSPDYPYFLCKTINRKMITL
jgi:hypothetical protein